MKKVVFFNDPNKIKEALSYFNMKSFSGKEVPIKLHMGEIKNKWFVRPEFVKKVVDALKDFDSKPYLFDTTVAYRAMRNTKIGYKKVAQLHGFTNKNVACDVVIDDSGVKVKIEGREFEVADHIYNSDPIFALSHVKGHVASGMGAAIKNLGMGGVTKETKSFMHNSSKPVYQKDKCTYCGVCSELCPFGAIKVDNQKWKIKKKSCFGCGVCVESCKSDALSYVDTNIQYLLACAAKACVQNKNVIYLNDINRISPGCDCDPFAGKPVAPDIGYLVSDDIVAIDKASLDLVNDVKKDVFIKENKVDPIKQIKFGEEINLGSTSYQLIEI